MLSLEAHTEIETVSKSKLFHGSSPTRAWCKYLLITGSKKTKMCLVKFSFCVHSLEEGSEHVAARELGDHLKSQIGAVEH